MTGGVRSICRRPTADASRQRICVVGGGFGGLYTALRLQKLPWKGRKPLITLVDKRDKFTFLPLLYEYAGEGEHRRVLEAWLLKKNTEGVTFEFIGHRL